MVFRRENLGGFYPGIKPWWCPTVPCYEGSGETPSFVDLSLEVLCCPAALHPTLCGRRCLLNLRGCFGSDVDFDAFSLPSVTSQWERASPRGSSLSRVASASVLLPLQADAGERLPRSVGGTFLVPIRLNLPVIG